MSQLIKLQKLQNHKELSPLVHRRLTLLERKLEAKLDLVRELKAKPWGISDGARKKLPRLSKIRQRALG